MYLVKVRETLREVLQGTSAWIVPPDMFARSVRVRCKPLDRGRLVRMIEVAGLAVRPISEQTCIEVTS